MNISRDILYPDSKVHVADMGPTWVLPAPDGPHIGPMSLAIRGSLCTSCQLGLPGCVLVLSPVNTSRIPFWCSISIAICSPMPFISFLPCADVMNICISRKLLNSSSRLPSSSNWASRLTNHSKWVWSRLIQIKSTYITKKHLLQLILSHETPRHHVGRNLHSFVL